ncbi:MAG TPA: dienelactone hydrolase family protein [Steroidobacteraceae bacterium]|nr:dienelactone hydrolase family protein [Steroidobacteraceae bacterium]
MAPIEIETAPNPQAAIIWLHGIDADGQQPMPVANQLAAALQLPLRFVLPHAPERAVTLFGGRRTRAWYDIRDADRQLQQDEAAIRASAALVQGLIAREVGRGIDARRLVLAGFSQGGAMALFTATRHPRRLAGAVALSCYRLLAPSFDAERQAANRGLPIFLAHGTEDTVIPLREGETTREVLRQAGYPVAWHTYRMGHEVIAAEIAAIAAFLRGALAQPPVP